jgi:hypothetical protein
MSGSALGEQLETISTAAGWSALLPFAQFPTASGALSSVGLSLTSTVTSIASIENLGATSATVQIDLPGTVTVMQSGTTLAADYADNHAIKTLGSFDGTINFAGTSGLTTRMVTTQTAAATATVATAGFSGSGTVGLTGSYAVGTVNEVAMGNIFSVTQGEASAVVGLQYNAQSATGTTVTDFSPGNPIAWNLSNGSENTIKGAATTAPQQLVVSDATTNWDNDFTIQQFNPALGTLEGIQIRFVDDINAGFAVQNLGTSATSVQLNETLDFGFILPGMTMLSLSGGPEIFESLALGAFNGTVSFSGPSGFNLSGLQEVGGEGIGAFANDLAAYIGTGTVNVEMLASSPSTVTGGGDLAMELLTKAGAELDISYIYQPATAVAPGLPTISNTLTAETTVLRPVSGAFSEIILTNQAPGIMTVTVTPSSIDNGTLVGLAGQPGGVNVSTGVWTVTGSLAVVMKALDDLSFLPTATVPAGGSVTTVFTIVFSDAFGRHATDSSTTITQLPNTAVNTGSAIAATNLALEDQSVPSTPVVTTGTVAAVTCFAAGTRIATPGGQAAVEDLRPGDAVLTESGEERTVRWIGHRFVDCRRHPKPERVWPIRVARHAFGMNRPRRPLLLSPDHAVFSDGVLVPVKCLVNGASIRQIRSPRVTYYHLELPSHDVVLAENLPCESYLETGGRACFDNGGTVVSLYPDFAGGDEARAQAIWREQAYAPLIGSAETLDRLQARLAFQAVMLGYQADGSLPCRARSSGPRGRVAVNETRAQ